MPEFLNTIPCIRWRRIKYEELVSRPEIELKSICEYLLALPYDAAMATPYATTALQSFRVKSGTVAATDPKLLRHQDIDPSHADKWKDPRIHPPDLSLTLHIGRELGFDFRPMLGEGVLALNSVVDSNVSPLFLIHDITGMVLHLEGIAALLPMACYGIECQRTMLDQADTLTELGAAYARIVTRTIRQGAQHSPTIRIGGYSYGCRIAFAAAKVLEDAGHNIDLVLLDGSIDGPVRVGPDRFEQFALDIFLIANGLDHDLAGNRVLELVKENATGSNLVELERILGIDILRSLLDHMEVVKRLATLTANYTATHKFLQGRLLRIVSETPPSMTSTLALAPHAVIKEVKGDHFSFFRVDTQSAAMHISQFLLSG